MLLSALRPLGDKGVEITARIIGFVENVEAGVLGSIGLAFLLYTSGTTGRPKGVMCTHWNMVSAAKSIIRYLGNTEDDVILDVLPLSFGYGLYQVLTSCMFGGTGR